MVSEEDELLAVSGALEAGGGTWHVLFVERYVGSVGLAAGPAGTVVLTLDRARGDAPEGWAILDLLGRTVEGTGGEVVDSVREFCRKRGIRFSPGPWRYPGGLV